MCQLQNWPFVYPISQTPNIVMSSLGKPMSHHKIWETGKRPYKRNDKGRRKPVQARNARKRLAALKKKYGSGKTAPFSFVPVGKLAPDHAIGGSFVS